MKTLILLTLLSGCSKTEDIDGDGYCGLGWGGNDCNDGDSTINPGAEEIPYGHRSGLRWSTSLTLMVTALKQWKQAAMTVTIRILKVAFIQMKSHTSGDDCDTQIIPSTQKRKKSYQRCFREVFMMFLKSLHQLKIIRLGLTYNQSPLEKWTKLGLTGAESTDQLLAELILIITKGEPWFWVDSNCSSWVTNIKYKAGTINCYVYREIFEGVNAGTGDFEYVRITQGCYCGVF